MLRYTLRRVPSALVVLVVASVAVFGLIHLAKGDPAAEAAGPDASPAQVAAKRHELGLDSSLVHQYLSWSHGLITGHLGRAYVSGTPISQLIGNSIGNTIELTAAASLLTVVFGTAAGLLLGTMRRRFGQAALGGLVGLAFAIPTYVSGVLLVLLFAVTWPILPAGGHESLLTNPEIGVQYLILPALCLALPAIATVARFLATAVRQQLDEEYLRTGVAKGLTGRRLLLRHALPNALPPVLAVTGIQIGQMLGGAIVVEAIFAWPGVGQLIRDSVLNHEYLVVQDLLLFAVAVFVVIQMVVDLLHAAVDPRVRAEV
jgi:peptide/nickel transport system permease protein